jgi:hypothetical protein
MEMRAWKQIGVAAIILLLTVLLGRCLFTSSHPEHQNVPQPKTRGEFQEPISEGSFSKKTLPVPPSSVPSSEEAVPPEQEKVTIEGRVVHAEKGTPVKVFQVTWKDKNGRGQSGSSFQNVEEKRAVALQGVFKISHPGPVDTLLKVQAQGFETGMFPIHAEDWGKPLACPLKPAAAALEGKVVDAKGSGIEDALIFSMPAQFGERIFSNARACSGEQGVFFLNAGGEFPRIISAWHPDYAPSYVVLEAPPTRGLPTFKIMLPGPGTLQGHVGGGGGSLQNCKIRVFYPEEMLEIKAFSATSDEAGNFRVTGLPPGRVTVWAEHNDLKARQEAEDVEILANNITGLDFSFSPAGASVEGVVLMDGKPLRHGDVWFDNGATRVDGACDDQGAFIIENVPPGEGFLCAKTEQGEVFIQQSLPIRIALGAALYQDIELCGAETLSGEVVGGADFEALLVLIYKGARSTNLQEIMTLVDDEDTPRELVHFEFYIGLFANPSPDEWDGYFEADHLQAGLHTVCIIGANGDEELSLSVFQRSVSVRVKEGAENHVEINMANAQTF